MIITQTEGRNIARMYRQLLQLTRGYILPEHIRKIRSIWEKAIEDNLLERPVPEVQPLERCVQNALVVAREIGMKRSSVISALLYDSRLIRSLELKQLERDFGPSVGNIMRGLIKVNELYDRNIVFDNENFRNLLLSFAQDVRVILILLADRLNTMRMLKRYPEEMQEKIAREVFSLYVPLAHRIGLYSIKTELEDLYLKFTQRAIYDEIARKLDETKRSRDEYIRTFIEPVRQKLSENLDVPFEIKGRVKSIYSIWNKLRKQQISFDSIYDLFAIRVILDTDREREKSDCWKVYSLITDMFQPNPARLKDWLSIPKSNGYESLHTTVLGPGGRWVEVQIRSARMDEIAERGLAAHWRYKGIRSEEGLDEMMTHIREVLSNQESDSLRLMDAFKLELYEKEIYVFTPKGELCKLPAGATVLDFAYSIHTDLGNKCVGAMVNGKNVPIRYPLKNGDAVEIQSGSNQSPKQDWLNYVVTARARNRIKQTLKEQTQKQAEYGREILQRRMKNRKLEFDEGVMTKVVRKFKYKTLTDFHAALGTEQLDLNQVIDQYVEWYQHDKIAHEAPQATTAEKYVIEPTPQQIQQAKEDILMIDQNLKGIDFTLSKCCHPIYGDEVFGFVSVTGGIKIHREDCPNAPQMKTRFPYRIVKARWAGKSGAGQYAASLEVIGKDDIGIVTNISSLISKESDLGLRSVRIDSNDGLFRGFLTVVVQDARQLEALIKKIKTIKGVKQVERGA
jgi:GTP pyrophosphokinase